MHKAPYVRWWWSDWIADTAHLGHIERGIYITLLGHYYQHRRPLPASVDDVCRIANALTPEERRACELILERYFYPSSDDSDPFTDSPNMVWRHSRAEREMEHADRQYREKSEGGKAGAAKRWLQRPKDGIPNGIPISTPTGTPNGNQNQNQNYSKPEKQVRTADAELALADPPGPLTKIKKPHRVNFDWTTHRFTGLEDADILRWQEAYPGISVPDQLDRLALWLKANPNRRKSNYERFIINCLSNAQDRGRPAR